MERFFDQPRAHNSFMPSYEQCQYLVDHQKEIKKSSLKEWYYQNLDAQYPSLFRAVIGSQTQKVYEDQFRRANAILNYMIKNNLRHLVFLDGHGRFLWSFIRAILKAKLKPADFSFEVVDIDINCHWWHCLFLPSAVKCVLGDIFDIANYHKTQNRACFIYFNFCAISNDEMRLKTLTTLQSLTHWAISASIRAPNMRRRGRAKKLSTCRMFAKLANIKQVEQVCERLHFRTYIKQGY